MCGIVDIAQVLPKACSSGICRDEGWLNAYSKAVNGKAVFVTARLMTRWIAKRSDTVILWSARLLAERLVTAEPCISCLAAGCALPQILL
jgi:hypothetical protein